MSKQITQIDANALVGKIFIGRRLSRVKKGSCVETDTGFRVDFLKYHNDTLIASVEDRDGIYPATGNLSEDNTLKLREILQDVKFRPAKLSMGRREYKGSVEMVGEGQYEISGEYVDMQTMTDESNDNGRFTLTPFHES